MPDRRGGDFLDRLDYAPGGSLGAAEEGRPVRQDRPHLPHSARNRLKTDPRPRPRRGGAFLPRPFPRHHRKPDPGRWPRPRPVHGGPSRPISPPIVIPSWPSPAPIAAPRPAPGAAGRANTALRRCTRHGARRRIAASSLPTAPRRRSGRIPTPNSGRSRGGCPRRGPGMTRDPPFIPTAGNSRFDPAPTDAAVGINGGFHPAASPLAAVKEEKLAIRSIERQARSSASDHN